MDAHLSGPLPYPTTSAMSASTAHSMPGVKRKRDSEDEGQSNERSTSRINPGRYSISQQSSGDAFSESFFNLDHLAAASSAAPREQHGGVRAPAEAQMTESNEGRIISDANNAFATPGLSASQMNGYIAPSPPRMGTQDPSPAIADASAVAGIDDGHGEDNEGNGEESAHFEPKNVKPIVGTDEWHKQRKMSHKEVERRRRSTINDAITALAALLPKSPPRDHSQSTFNSSNRSRGTIAPTPIVGASDKNKGAILASAVTYIRTLRDERDTSINKWTFEKMVTDEAIRTLEGRLERMARVAEGWKRIAKEAGVDVEDVEVAVRVYGGVNGAGGEGHGESGRDKGRVAAGEAGESAGNNAVAGSNLGRMEGVAKDGLEDAGQ